MRTQSHQCEAETETTHPQEISFPLDHPPVLRIVPHLKSGKVFFLLLSSLSLVLQLIMINYLHWYCVRTTGASICRQRGLRREISNSHDDAVIFAYSFVNGFSRAASRKPRAASREIDSVKSFPGPACSWICNSNKDHQSYISKMYLRGRRRRGFMCQTTMKHLPLPVKFSTMDSNLFTPQETTDLCLDL